MQYLVLAGIEPNRIRLSQAGASEPRLTSQGIDPNENARVEVYLLGETYEPPSEMVQRLVSTQAAILEADEDGEKDDSQTSTSSHGNSDKSGHAKNAKPH
jgi:hypothetical protein